MTGTIRRASAVVLLLLTAGAAGPAGAALIEAGWTHAYVGLENEGDGIYLSFSNEIPWNNEVFDASYELAYVQKAGSQPTFFSDPVTGFTTEDAEVTLHYLQPGIFLGARVPGLDFVPRIYTGFSIDLKVSENWSGFPGIASEEYGYKNTDLDVHVGATLGVGPVLVDFRFSQGLTGQLLQDNQPLPLAKAEEPPEGYEKPVVGAKIHHYQLGVGFAF